MMPSLVTILRRRPTLALGLALCALATPFGAPLLAQAATASSTAGGEASLIIPDLSQVTFLGVNSYDLMATDAEVVAEILALAVGGVFEEALTAWIRRHSSRLR